jgi:hypothetical protein
MQQTYVFMNAKGERGNDPMNFSARITKFGVVG